MPIDPEKLAQGRAVIDGKLGGATAAAPLQNLIEATREAFALHRQPAAEAWPDSVAEAIGFVDSAFELAADNAAKLGVSAGEVASWRAIAESVKGERPLELAPQAGERTTSEGEPIRSNAAWRALATAALAERDAAQCELAKARAAVLEAERRAADNWKARDAAQARANNAEAEHARSLELALVFGAESDERGALLAEFAEVLAAVPLAILASAAEAGRLAALYLRAEVLTAEEPAERFERLRARLESGK